MDSRGRRNLLLRCGAIALLAVWAQYLLTQRRALVWDGVLLYALAMALFAGLLRSEQRREGLGGLGWLWAELWRALGRSPLRLAMLLIGVGLVVVVSVVALSRPWQRSFFDLGLAWVLGLALYLGALLRWRALWMDLRSLPRHVIQPEGALVAALVVATVLLRAVNPEQIPPVLSGDEASFGLDALQVLSGQRGNPFTTGWLSHPTLYAFIQAVFIRLLGRSATALRLSSALISGGVTLWLYLLGRRWWGRWQGLLAALFFACYHYAIHFGRLGLNNIWDPFWALGGLYCLTVGLERDRLAPTLIAGLMAGLAFYFYLGARLAPLLLVLVTILWSLGQRGFWRQHLPKLFLAAGLALLTALPLLLFFGKNPELFAARWRWVGIIPSGWLANEAVRTGQSTWALLGQQVAKTVLAFNHSLDPTFWYRPGRPLLLFGSAICFVLGLTTALVQWRRREHQLTLVWLGLVLLFGGVLLENPPSSPRLVMAIPPVVYLVVLGMAQVGVWLRRALGAGRVFGYLVSLTLVLLACAGSLHFYFAVYTPGRMFSDDNTATADAIARYLRPKGEGTICFLLGPPRLYWGHATIPYLAEGVIGVDVLQPVQAPGDLTVGEGAVFVVLPEREPELEVIRSYYPGGAVARYKDPKGSLLFITYELGGATGQD